MEKVIKSYYSLIKKVWFQFSNFFSNIKTHVIVFLKYDFKFSIIERIKKLFLILLFRIIPKLRKSLKDSIY
jgi:hypothetical protein